MVSRTGGGGLFRTAASGGGSVPPDSSQVRLPEVVTGTVATTAGVALASALFSATVTPNGEATTLYWRYGLAGAAASLVTGQFDIPGSALSTGITVSVSGLELSTDYEVTAYAEHTDGPLSGQPVSGGVVAFTTPAASTAPPTAVTLAASAIGSDAATLNGRFNPKGTATDGWFTYTAANGVVIETDRVAMGSGTAPVLASDEILGLTPDSDYTVQAVSENSAGQRSYGQPIPFHTLTDTTRPEIDTLVFSQITATTALATVTLDTGGLLTSVFLSYGTSTAYGTTIQVDIAAGETQALIPIRGLTQATLYYASVFAVNALGGSLPVTETFTTLNTANFPTGNTSLPSGIDVNFATLHALVDPNTVLTTVTFEYWDADAGAVTLPMTVTADATSSSGSETDFSVRVTNLQPYRQYAYRALASNAVGSLTGSVVTFRTKGRYPGTTVAVTTTTPATLITSNSATVAGTLADASISTTYYFEFWITGTNKKFTPARFVDYIGLSEAVMNYTVYEPLTGLTANSTYNFRLCAVSAADPAIQYGTTRTFTTAAAPGTPPATATMQSLLPISSTILRAKATSLNTNGEDTDIRFQVSRTLGFAAIEAESAIVTVADPSNPLVLYGADITGLTANTTYYGRLKMVHATGTVTSYSNTVSGTTSILVAPSVTTNALTGATPSTLQASASVTVPTDIGAGSTFVWFAYGTTSQSTGFGYDVVSAEQNVGSVAGVFVPTLQLGGPASPPPLIASTGYYCRAFARNLAGTVMGSEVGPTSTSGGSSGLLPIPVASAPTANIPNSFNMHGTVVTNGGDTTIVFQFVDATAGHLFDTADMQETTGYVVVNHALLQLVGRNTGYHLAISHAWQFRIKATNSAGTAYSATISVPAVTPSAFIVQTIQNRGHLATATHVGFLDSTSARLAMWFRHAGYERVWMQMEWGAASDLTGSTKSRMVSHQAAPADPPVSPEYLECHYADYLTGLSAATTYYYRLRCWSIGGDHTGAIANFTTDAGGSWSANWVASVGTQKAKSNVMGLIPKDLRLGTGTIARSTSATDTTHDVDFGNFAYTGSSEDAYSIFVTATGITKGTGWDAAHPTLPSFVNKVQSDRVAGCNIAYALQRAGIGDKVWIDGSTRGMLYRFDGGSMTGLIVAGNTVSDTGVVATATWSALVTYIANVAPPSENRCIALRLLTGTLPSSGAAGTAIGTIYISNDPTRFITGCKKVHEGAYTYQAPDLGGDGGSTGQVPTSQEAYWIISGKYYPLTGLRILALDPAYKPQLNQMGIHRDHGSLNGVFFKNIDFNRGIWADNYCVAGAGLSGLGGGGVVGFYDCDFRGTDIDGSLGNRGVKTMVKGDSPHTWDFRRCTFSPAQEHSCYGESFGEVNPQDIFLLDNTITGTNWDGTKDFNGRTMFQETCRGDHWQNKGSGSGFPPGRSTIYCERNTARTDTTDGGQAFSFWGHHGTINAADNVYLGSASAGSVDSGSFLTQMDIGKGGWFNEHGFAVTALNLSRHTVNVNNTADTEIQINSTETVTITDFLITMNNQVGFAFLGPNSSFDNGRITIVLTLGSGVLTTYVDSASPRTFGWDPSTTWAQRMQHHGVSISTGTTTPIDPTAVNAFQNGVQYKAIV